jgi:TatD DNase family protein
MEDRICSMILQHRNRCLAWGEFGLDFFRNISEVSVQRRIFIRQLVTVRSRFPELPIVIHSRDAGKETFEDLITSQIPNNAKIHMHSFSDDVNLAKRMLEKFPQIVFGITGAIFNPRSNIVKVVSDMSIPIERFLLETDAPWMPMPNQKSSNPGIIPNIATQVAKIRGMEISVIMAKLFDNAVKFYNIKF